MLFGFPGQLFSLRSFTDDFFAYYMLFTEKFIEDVLLKQNRHQHLPFLTYSGLQCFSADNATAQEIEELIFKINSEIKRRKPHCSEMIKLYIYQICLHANRCYGTLVFSNRSYNALQSLYSDFLKSVSLHFLTVRKVSAYAKMLHVSPDHLNRAIKSCTDKTAHQLIDEMIIIEAKAYLLHTSFTVAEIAYKLDFADPSHFNRFFKKYCTVTPAEFRNQS